MALLRMPPPLALRADRACPPQRLSAMRGHLYGSFPGRGHPRPNARPHLAVPVVAAKKPYEKKAKNPAGTTSGFGAAPPAVERRDPEVLDVTVAEGVSVFSVWARAGEPATSWQVLGRVHVQGGAEEAARALKERRARVRAAALASPELLAAFCHLGGKTGGSPENMAGSLQYGMRPHDPEAEEQQGAITEVDVSGSRADGLPALLVFDEPERYEIPKQMHGGRTKTYRGYNMTK